jgi:hypothetical protein
MNFFRYVIGNTSMDSKALPDTLLTYRNAGMMASRTRQNAFYGRKDKYIFVFRPDGLRGAVRGVYRTS